MKNIEAFKILFCVFVICNFLIVNSFNLSPQPNYIFREPRIYKDNTQNESSYFGFSVNLREKSLMVGAPKAQSILYEQHNINKFGAVYKCNFATNNCDPYHLDLKGNGNSSDRIALKKYENLKKENQWLGAVMDGSKSENDLFVVCAPNVITDVINSANFAKNETYLFHGICYVTSNTTDPQPRSPNTLSDLRLKTIPHNHLLDYGQQGFSLHVTENKEEILMGAPGVSVWRGSVLHYKTNSSRSFKNDYEFYVHASNISQNEDSYFGYGITSGYLNSRKPKKLFYVSSAPRGNNMKGVVFIYSFRQIIQAKYLKIYKRFDGKQMGEYFGYALLTEDFNNDGLFDLAISAPLHSRTSTHDNGRVYLLYNKGNITFSNYQYLDSNAQINGRFGTSLGKIGDINRDGFNDLAVGAPFEDNGAVYIFLGSSTGLLKNPSQRLTAVAQNPLPFGGNHMFGMSISRGVDIDGNKYNDIVIGAPNADAIYVYKSYPVVQIISTIESVTPEIGLNETEFNIRACWKYNSTTTIPFDIFVNLSIKLDFGTGRTKFLNSKDNVFSRITSLPTPNMMDCFIENVRMEYLIADIFKPISIELSIDLLNKSSNSLDFCNQCVVRNPTDETVVRNFVHFSTGCKDIVCIADLKINSSIVDANFSIPYIIGSTKTITIEYIVENTGETAYGAYVTIWIPKYLKFYKISSNCIVQTQFILQCQFVNNLHAGQQERIIIEYDVSHLQGKIMFSKATASSSGKDSNNNDNSIRNDIPLQEFSEIEIHGKSSPLSISIDEIPAKIFEIKHQFEIRNSGPSSIKHITFNVYIPSMIITYANFKLIDVENIVSKGFYKNEDLEFVWPIDDEYNKNDIYENNNQNVSNEYDSNFPNVHVDRKVVLSCDDEGVINCLKGTLDIRDFESGNTPINIEITFSIDLNKVETDERDLLVFITLSEIIKKGDNNGTTLKIVKFSPYTVFTINNTPSTPIILCIVSAVLGILLLLLLSNGMSKMGFFKRNTKVEMEILKNNVKAYECDAPFAL